MRVLIVSPTPTHPPNQGNRLRIHQVAAAFKKQGARVDFFYYALEETDRLALDEMAETWDSLYLVRPGNYSPRQKWPGLWGIDDWVSPHLIEAARALDAIAK